MKGTTSPVRLTKLLATSTVGSTCKPLRLDELLLVALLQYTCFEGLKNES